MANTPPINVPLAPEAAPTVFIGSWDSPCRSAVWIFPASSEYPEQSARPLLWAALTQVSTTTTLKTLCSESGIPRPDGKPR